MQVSDLSTVRKVCDLFDECAGKCRLIQVLMVKAVFA